MFHSSTSAASLFSSPSLFPSLRQHYLTPLNLIAAEASCHLAMWADDRWLAGDHDAKVRMVTPRDGFLKSNELRASQIGAPNGEVPLWRCAK
jgi:hypothetical protein